MKQKGKEHTIILIGSVPPPFHGVCIQNQILLNSDLKEHYKIIHIPNSFKKNIHNIGTISILNILSALISYFNLFRLLLSDNYYIVYFTLAQNNIGFFRDSVYILISKFFKKTKVLIHCRGSIYYKRYINSSNLIKKYIDFIYSKTDFCIILSRKLENMMSKWFSPENIFIIPNGTNFKNRFFKDDKDLNGMILGYIGVISEEKGIFELIESFIELNKKYEKIKLFIAGSFLKSETRENVNDILHNNSLDGNIMLLGNIDGIEKEKFYNDIDILLVPSWHEGHPNVILEAMVSKLPVIAFDVGAVSESVIENYNGFLVPVKNVGLLTEKIECLINNTSLIKIMGKNSFELYLKKFREEIYINNMINAFNQITKYEII